MAYDEHLAERIGRVLRQNHISFEEKKMMGGLCFMVDDKMCVGITKGKLMARIHPDLYVQVLEKEGCQEMNFTGRPMKGFVFVEPKVIDLDEDLEYWVQLGLDFNPLARRSKKR
jgi:TfoX/Sxy family transcriptional regulator of competence genes